VRGGVRDQLGGDRAVPGRLARAVPAAEPPVPVVHRQAVGTGVLLHLGAVDVPALPLRPAHAPRLEGAAADLGPEPGGDGNLGVREEQPMIPILFIGFAALLVGCSLMVILNRNPVTSALWLVLGFVSLAGLYLLLQAEFLAMVQIIVYAGAIMVLFLFVIM